MKFIHLRILNIKYLLQNILKFELNSIVSLEELQHGAIDIKKLKTNELKHRLAMSLINKIIVEEEFTGRDIKLKASIEFLDKDTLNLILEELKIITEFIKDNGNK